jgi:hypothetical protein
LAAEIERRELRKAIYGPEKETTFEEIALVVRVIQTEDRDA